MTQEPPVDRDPFQALPPELGQTSAGQAGIAQDTSAASHAPEAVQSLKQAMRRARFDDAERVGVMAELRSSQIGRLELLHESLRPLLAQIPRDVDLFDVGIMPGATPRLFIDMIGFVEMGRDTRLYRLVQDTRHSRVTLAETTEIGRMVEAVTDYVARRLLERDKALAADALDRGDGHAVGAPLSAPPSQKNGATVVTALQQSPEPEPKPPATIRVEQPRRARRAMRLGSMTFAFVIDLLGATTLFTILAVVGWYLWNRLHGQV